MKRIFFIITVSLFIKNGTAQNTGGINAIPGQPMDINTNGLPAQQNTLGTNTVNTTTSGSNSITPLVPGSNIQTPAAIDNPYVPGATNTITSPPTYTPKNNFNLLFQDPMKTPKHPNQATHVGTVDGSKGKFKNPHVDHGSKNSFASNSHHLTKSKIHKEKASGTAYEATK